MLTRSKLLSKIGAIGSSGDNLRRLKEQVESASGVLPFVGAGLSRQFGFPLWGEFLREQAQQASGVDIEKKIQDRLDAGEYEEAAEDLLNTRTAFAFHDAIENTFGPHKLDGKELSGAVSLLPRIAAGPVITTNFDRVLEKVFELADKPFARVVPGAKADAAVQAFHQNQRLLLKIHGDALESTERILTRKDYETYYGSADTSKLDPGLPLPKLLQLMMTARSLLFVGCSLNQDRTVAALYQMAREFPRIGHYAIVERPEDDQRYRERFTFLSEHNVRPIWYPHGKHELIESILGWLVNKTDSSDDGVASRQPPLPATEREDIEDAGRDRHDTQSSVRSSDISLGDHVQPSQRGKLMNDTTDEVVFNWLHLTDLHWGMEGFEDKWWNVGEDFFKDLKTLINNAQIAPLDLVLFTGDLAYSGKRSQFEAVEEHLIRPLWDMFDEMGFGSPKLLAVPGNHDLDRKRPKNKSALNLLTLAWDYEQNVRGPFWDEEDDAGSDMREVVAEAFADYDSWWQSTQLKPPIHSGMLAGDFSTTIAKEGYKLGIVGLNSAFLQLSGGDLKGKLALANRQFNKACEGRVGPKWVQKHDLCLLLTHHPPDWLTEQSQSELDSEIDRAGRFVFHMFGHMHKDNLTSLAVGGGETRRQLQGCALYAMDGWGEGNKNERTHGYSLGQLKIEDDKALMRLLPRKRKGSGSGEMRASDDFTLPDDRATRWDIVKTDIPLRPKLPTSNGSHTLQESKGMPVTLADPYAIDMTIQGWLNGLQQSAVDATLTTRLDALEQSLNRVKHHTYSWPSRLRLEDVGLDSKIEDQEELIGIIRTSLKEVEEEADETVVGERIKQAWLTYGQGLGESANILREWLDVMSGLSLRDLGLDKSLFDMADQLIKHCAAASSTDPYLSIPALQGSLARTAGSVIRLRFPDWTIWDLPFATHEYGLVAVDKVEGLKELVERTTRQWVDEDRQFQLVPNANEEQIRKKRYNNQLRILFADAYATHTMGPAYACTAILLYFDPVLGYDENKFFHTRARVVLSMLGCMDREARGTPYKVVIDPLDHRWNTALSRANPLGGLDAKEEQRLSNFVDSVWAMLRGENFKSALYPPEGETGWQVAKRWAAMHWLKQLKIEGEQSLDVIYEATHNKQLPDALNAGWLCRIARPDQIGEITKVVDDQCKLIMESGSRDGPGRGGPPSASPPKPSV